MTKAEQFRKEADASAKRSQKAKTPAEGDRERNRASGLRQLADNEDWLDGKTKAKDPYTQRPCGGAMPIAAEDIVYKIHRLEVRPHASGWAVFIYPPSSRLSLDEVPSTRHADERQKVIDAAKAIVDRLAP